MAEAELHITLQSAGTMAELGCEMKRLYVRSRFRGLKIGKMLTDRIIHDAKEIGYDYMLLDTLSMMESARALYKRLGFKEISSYYDSPIKNTYYLCCR